MPVTQSAGLHLIYRVEPRRREFCITGLLYLRTLSHLNTIIGFTTTPVFNTTYLQRCPHLLWTIPLKLFISTPSQLHSLC